MTDMNALESLYFAALEKPPADRPAFLEAACGTDADLRERVERLLAALPKVGDFLASADPPTGTFGGSSATANFPGKDEHVGAILGGKYKLLERIGEGGMGDVWLAHQTEPVKRQVAVKLIKSGMDSKQVLARFEAERQALAMMDHPNIAKVLDGGLNENRPYFVMELVKGVPITEYCDHNKLTPKQRLELFVPVCQAIQHAHQKGVIHRDIKPSNVLIAMYDDRPVPKVIDFGVAKATGATLTEHTLNTGFGGIVGTPQYMSPEQATFNNLDIDTRSDVYSLGVLLYELLTGSPPFAKKELEKRGLLEILRVVREEEPPKPSTKLSTADAFPSLSASRSTEPKKLTALLRNELDWIVMKSLEKDRTRRYDTANGFAADVNRYLSGEPVQAHPPSAGYRLKTFVRRNRLQVIAANLIIIALMAGIAGTTFGLIRANRSAEAERLAKIEAEVKRSEAEQARFAEAARAEGERLAKLDAQASEKLASERLIQVGAEKKKADEEKQIAQSVRDFLQNKLLAQTVTRTQAETLLKAGASSSGAKLNPTIRELVDLAAKELAPDKIEESFPMQPLIQAEILRTIGNTYRGIGEYQKAIDFLKRAEALRRQQLGPKHPDTLTSMQNLALAYRVAGKLDLALPLFEETLKVQKAKLGPEHPLTLNTMNDLAETYRAAGKLELALPLLEQTLMLRKARLSPDHSSTLTSRQNLALAYKDAGKLDLALPLLEEALKLSKTKLGPEHPDTLVGMGNLAALYWEAGKRDLALPLFEETLKLTKAKLGPEHTHTLHSRNNLAVAYQQVGKLDLALQLHNETLKFRKARLGPEHPDTLNSMYNLAVANQLVGKLDLALPLFEETLKLQKTKLGTEHPNTLICMGNLGKAYLEANQSEKASAIFKEFVAGQRRRSKPDDPQFAGLLAQVALDLLNCRQHAASEEMLRECLAIREKKEPDVWTTFNTKSLLGGALLGQKKYTDAEPLLRTGYEGMKHREKTIPPQGSTRIPEALDRLIELYTATNKPDEVKKWRAERSKYPEVTSPSREPGSRGATLIPAEKTH